MKAGGRIQDSGPSGKPSLAPLGERNLRFQAKRFWGWRRHLPFGVCDLPEGTCRDDEAGARGGP